MPKNLLVYRLAVINILFMAALIAGWQIGWARMVWDWDSTPVTKVICALFLLGLGSTAWHALRLQRLSQKRVVYAGEIKSGANPQRITHIKWIADWLTYIGFFGTVVGFSVSLSAAANGISDASTITGMLAGMKLSFAPTLAGCVFGLWTEVNYLQLETAAVLKSEG